MPIHVKVGGTWKTTPDGGTPNGPKVRVGGVWKDIQSAFIKVPLIGWKRLWIPTIACDSFSFTTPGSFNWVVPTGVTLARTTIIGGGGGGGGGFGGGGGGGAGGQGGGSGGIDVQYFTVVPGASIPVTVGSAGAGRPLNAGAGFAGTSSSFNGVVATGGQGGIGWFEAGGVFDFSQMGIGGTPSGEDGTWPSGIAFGGPGTGGEGGSVAGYGVGGINGTPGTGYGAGGGGGAQVNYGFIGPGNGANGAPGAVIVEWFDC